MACFNFIIIDFVPCHPTIILSGNVWQQESFQDPSVSSNSGGSIKSCKINMSCLSQHLVWIFRNCCRGRESIMNFLTNFSSVLIFFFFTYWYIHFIMDNLFILPLIQYQEVSGIDGHLIYHPRSDSQVRII